MKPDERASKIVQCSAGAEWADDKGDGISASSGVLKYCGSRCCRGRGVRVAWP